MKKGKYIFFIKKEKIFYYTLVDNDKDALKPWVLDLQTNVDSVKIE